MTRRALAGVATVLSGLILTGCVRTCPLTGIRSIDRAVSAVHTPVRITGWGFGDTQGSSVVTFDGLPAEVLSWTDTEITVRVPVIATPNGRSTPVQVVVAARETFRPFPFTVVRGILFTSTRDGQEEIYVMNPDGTGQTNLTRHPAAESFAAWSPDGTKVAFRSNRDGNLAIYIMDANGSNQTRLTTAAAADTHPCWSPDGRKIAFRSDRDGNPEIYVMDADGSNQTRLTFSPGYDTSPSWSPDGTKIAFDTTRDGNWEIYVMDADGTNLRRLTTDPGIDGRPAWWD